jgi:transcriptional regulator with XRE-family HTH domain
MRGQTGERTGAAIRKLRLAKGLTLAELSQQSGVPLSTLSRVELGQNALNSEKLIRLCRALDVDLQGLVTNAADSAVVTSGRRAVMRAGDGHPVKVGGNAGLRAAWDLTAKNLSPVIIEVSAASLDAHGPLAQLDGEAYLLVLAGDIVLHSHFYAPLPMTVGDAVYFDGRAGYGLVAPATPATVLLCATGEQGFEP